MDFDRTTDWQPDDDHRFTGAFDPGWGQGRAVFGGIQSAGALRLMRHLVPEGRPCTECHTRYVGPLPPGDFQAEVAVLRSGRSISQAEVRITGEKGLATVVLATFAAPRDSAIVVPSAMEPPDRPDPESLRALPYIPGVTPAFLDRMEMRWTDGTGPFTGSSEPVIGGWVRIKAGTSLDAAPVALALLDTFPSPALPMLTAPAPASTVSWTAWLHRLPPSGEGWWWFREQADFAEQGGVVSTGQLFAPDGTLAGTKTQLAAVYDR